MAASSSSASCGEGDLLVAARAADVQTLRAIIKAGCDVRVRDRLRQTALHIAVRARSPDCVRELIAADCPLDARRNDGKTALSLALFTKPITMLRALLDAGADPNIADCDNMTPLSAACRSIKKPLCGSKYFERFHDVIVEELLLAGADPNTPRRNRVSPLHDAAWSGRLECVKNLIAAGADVMATTVEGDTPMHDCLSIFGRYRSECAIELILAGARLCVFNNRDDFPWRAFERYDVILDPETHRSIRRERARKLAGMTLRRRAWTAIRAHRIETSVLPPIVIRMETADLARDPIARRHLLRLIAANRPPTGE